MTVVALVAPRYPLERLQRAAKAKDLHVLARRLGLTHGTVRNAAAAGLTERQADQWAIRLGLHPIHVWPQWADDAPDDDEIDAIRKRRSETAKRAALARRQASA